MAKAPTHIALHGPGLPFEIAPLPAPRLSGLAFTSLSGISSAVQPAFGFREIRPTARALVFAFRDRARAMSTTDARIASIVERIIGHVVFSDVAPHICLR